MVGPRKDLEDLLAKWEIECPTMKGGEAGRLVRVEPGDSKVSPDANMTIIWLRSRHIPTLAHELLHHLVLTFEEKGIPMNWDNTETMSYYLEYLIQEVLTLWHK